MCFNTSPPSDSSSDEDNWQNMRHEMKHQRTKLSMMRGGSPSPRDRYLIPPSPQYGHLLKRKIVDSRVLLNYSAMWMTNSS